ncbi:hypothetical protein [Parvibaculum sp.]
MINVIRNLNADDMKHVEDMARELSRYGLGVCVPHAHDANGEIVPLPDGIVSYERNLEVKFLPCADVPSSAEPVAWRWINGAMAVCAQCCKH